MLTARILLRTCAAGVAVLAVSVAIGGWMAVSGIARLGAPPSAATSTFEIFHDSLDLAVEVTGTIRAAMADLDALVATVADSSETTAQLLNDTADITSVQIPGSLRAIEQAMPGLIEAGAVIDDTLSTLSILGIDYRPETPLEAALQDIHVSIDGLSEDVATQGAALRTLVPEVERVQVTTASLAERVQETRDGLARAEFVLSDYRAVLGDAERSFGLATSPLLNFVLRVLLAAVGLSGAVVGFALWRLAPAAALWMDRHGHRTEDGTLDRRSGT